jgi:hypothetical protein
MKGGATDVPAQRALGRQQDELRHYATLYLVAQVGEKISGDDIKDRHI